MWDHTQRRVTTRERGTARGGSQQRSVNTQAATRRERPPRTEELDACGVLEGSQLRVLRLALRPRHRRAHARPVRLAAREGHRRHGGTRRGLCEAAGALCGAPLCSCSCARQKGVWLARQRRPGTGQTAEGRRTSGALHGDPHSSHDNRFWEGPCVPKPDATSFFGLRRRDSINAMQFTAHRAHYRNTDPQPPRQSTRLPEQLAAHRQQPAGRRRHRRR